MKEVIPCAECANCAVCLPCGFATVEHLMCLRDNQEVDDDDGCTLGERGELQTAAKEYDIDLSVTYNGMSWENCYE